jgi:hypothetical protein
MTEHAQVPTKALVYIGLFVGIWLAVTMVLMTAFKISLGWPAYLTLPLFFLAGNDAKQLLNLFVGGAVGIILAACFFPIYAMLTPALGAQLTPLVIIFIIIFLIIALGNAVPMVFNNFNLVYFTAAIGFYTIFYGIAAVTKTPYALVPETLKMVVVMIVGGAFFTGGTLLFIQKAIPKLMAPKGPSATHGM